MLLKRQIVENSLQSIGFLEIPYIQVFKESIQLESRGMFPRVFGDEFGDKFGDEFCDKFSELPNFVIILVMNLVMNLVNCQIR